MAYNNQQVAAWSIFKLKKLQERGVPWDPSNYKLAPTVYVDVVNCMPRFKLYMNEGGESSAISINLSPKILSQFLEAIYYITELKTPDKININVKGHFGANGVRQDQPFTQSVITIGRDTEGFVYMAFTIKGKKPAKFIFTDDRYAEFTNSAGETLDNSIKSNMCARGWAKMIHDLVTTYLAAVSTEPPTQQGGQKQSSTAPQQQYKARSPQHSDINDDDVPEWPSYPG